MRRERHRRRWIKRRRDKREEKATRGARKSEVIENQDE